jgi:hypothetical protein
MNKMEIPVEFLDRLRELQGLYLRETDLSESRDLAAAS